MPPSRWLILVAVSLVIVIAPAIWSWQCQFPGKLQPLAIWFAFVVLMLNLFRDFFTHILWPSILSLDVKMPHENIGLTPYKVKLSGQTLWGESFFWQLTVANRGPATARQVAVMLQRMERYDETSKRWKPHNFLPLNLQWAHRTDPFYPYIPRGVKRVCTLGRVLKPGRIQCIDEDGEITTIEYSGRKFFLQLEVSPTTDWHALEKGQYRLHLVIGGENTWITRKRVILNYGGEWNSNLTGMVDVT